MASELQPEELAERQAEAERIARAAAMRWLGILGLLAGVALILAISFARSEYAREQAAWATRLALVADGRAAAVDGWLSSQKKLAEDLSANTSVRLYTTDMLGGGDPASARAASEYVSALLAASGETSGFWLEPSQKIRANVDRPADRGIALLTPDGRLLAATPTLPDVSSVTRSGRASAITEWRLPSGGWAIAATAPVFGIQDQETTATPIAWIVAVRPLDTPLFEALKQPGDLTRTGLTFLARAGANGMELIDAGDTRGTVKPAGDVAAAVMGGLTGYTESRNAEGTEVIASGRPLKALTGWVLVRTVDRDEAIGPIESRWIARGAGLVFAVLALSAGILLAWRHGASVRVARLAEAERDAAARYRTLSGFLKTVTDSQPTLILAINRLRRISFANAHAISWGTGGGDDADLAGKSLTQVFGQASGDVIGAALDDALEGRGSRVTTPVSLQSGARTLLIHTVPLPDGTQATLDTTPSAALIVAEDLTDLMTERQKRESTLSGLVRTLATLMDARDPFAANHSARVAEVGGAIARAMGLDGRDADTVETAGTLLNIGKMMVPPELLTKKGKLNDDELRRIRGSLEQSASLIDHLPFDGPVAATLRQSQLAYDGGPMRVSPNGEDILLTARVLAVANNFVAMASPRAFRKGLGVDKALNQLLAEAGTRFDKGAVMALAHVIENEGGRARWQEFAGDDGVEEDEEL